MSSHEGPNFDWRACRNHEPDEHYAQGLPMPSGGLATENEKTFTIVSGTGLITHISKADIRALFLYLKGKDYARIQTIKDLYGDR